MSLEITSELQGSERDTPLLLVVDDDLIIRTMIRKSLETQGYEVIEASNGSEGVTAFRESYPDMVLLDVMMPVLNGFDGVAVSRNTIKSSH